mmetsp:Transcript_27611/g.35674  ORF Transcript_27611/g.35674 Transcript_27611/m.35674 type:complete len:127 (+) Transcript_27611:85-465(+)|eukprot:CAMPEP_0117758036 /NCGR_PEP_ID=MMETSP0947-20121206/15128_1 /TAXON_ID=44440 /ORGANISM="Chattonella subsalsa, Strain CCMP2191" /LENGTH=126 /DNA_ID=CAMNT_0005578125 /DNA_START=80 /DNA_END=460 /DNA_ORIENTATION=-
MFSPSRLLRQAKLTLSSANTLRNSHAILLSSLSKCHNTFPNYARFLSQSVGSNPEGAMAALLEEKLQASKVEVKDISGGCGSMYSILVESQLFKGKGLVQQHRMVKEILKTQIADMHGLTLHTKAP